MSDKDEERNLFDAIDGLVDLYEDNEDKIKEFFGGDDDVTIDDKEPLKQAIVRDEEAVVTVDVGGEELENINLNLEGSKAKIGIGDATINAKVPDDVNMGDAEAVLNNGVLEVTIPREGGEE